MKKSYKGWITVLGFAGAVFLSACNSTLTQVKEISIIPLPNSIVETSSAFVLPEKCTIGVTDKSLIPAADYLVSILSKSTGYQFSVTEGKGDINLSGRFRKRRKLQFCLYKEFRIYIRKLLCRCNLRYRNSPSAVAIRH